jgi:hypothetical protein
MRGSRFLILGALLGVMIARVEAFPPSPYFTLFGTIRDESGQMLATEGAQVLLLRGAAVVQRTPVTGLLVSGQNYELRIPIDLLRSGTTLYREAAIVARSGLQIAVEANGQRFFPLGTAGSLAAGDGSERVRFDFFMGVDEDGDGLPDAWEEWQLIEGQVPPGPDGYDLTLLHPDGDFDHDGVTDRDEYQQGTMAWDGGSRMWLEFKEQTPTHARFEFGAVAGRSYTLEASTNLAAWYPVTMSIPAPGSPAAVFLAEDSQTVSAWTDNSGGPRVFYRLIIQ